MNNRIIKIGVLCPYSTIYPTLNRDFMEGLLSGIEIKLHSQIQLIPEFVRQGEPLALKPALEKLLGMDNVDILTGCVGYRSMSEMIPIIERFKKVALFCDLGEYLPFIDNRSNYIFSNSMQYWQAEFAMGQWAQKEWGGKGSVFSPVYDIGYHMHSAFRHGALQSENCTMEYAVPRFDNNSNYNVKDAMYEYMEKFRKERPSYIHAIFSGNEALDFFEIYHKEGLHKEIPLIVSPHMASYEILRNIEHLELSFHSASLWNFESELKENVKFKRNYLSRTGEMANTFSLLGYEIGLALEQIHPYLMRKDADSIYNFLKTQQIRTPRGERNFDIDSNYATPIIDIEKITIDNKVNKVTVAQGKSFGYNHMIFEEIHRENLSGWFNPYLCV
jgi:branched-chain amino acid transport system substrate-binding protein